LENKEPATEELIETFFKERLDFKEVPEEMKNIMNFDSLLKRAELKMKKKKQELEPEPVITKIIDEEEGSGSEFYTDDEECDSIESEPDEEHRKFKAFLQDKAKEQDDFALDFEEVLDILDDALPEIPGKPQIQ